MPSGVYVRDSLEVRFWKKVTKLDSGCWEWSGYFDKGGYGYFKYPRGTKPHRYSYELHKGEIPAGMLVRHTCDNPKCVNPAHLLAGTSEQNTQDAVSRSRMARGERNGNAQLTEKEVLSVLNLRSQKLQVKDIMALTGFSRGRVETILYGKTWKYLKN